MSFSGLDYFLFFCIFGASVLIGIFSALKGNKSPDEFFLGNRSLKPVPVSMSLLASFISVVNIVGFTTEVYLHGTQLSLIGIGCIIGIINSMYVIVPVIYPLRLTSIHEYIQIRFNSPNLQVLLTLLVLVNSNVFIGVCLYGTTIVLTAVTPFNYTTCILVMGVVCTIYSTMGGIRAVVWTDVLQLIVMVIGILIYIIAGVIQVGGVEYFFSVLEEGQRLQFFNMNPSIYERHTFYNTIAFGAFFFGSIFGVTQLNSQRICSVGTQQEAKKVLMYTMVGFVVLHILVFLGGLVVYASYAGCDPLLEGKIENYSQILSYFIINKLGSIIGLRGIFAATLISSLLSTFSSTVNAAVALIWRDILMKFKIFSQSTPRRSALLSKLLTLICGTLFIVMAFIAAQTGNIIQLTLSISGIFSGSIFGVFMLGICFPMSTKRGAVIGIIFSCTFLIWIYIGSLKYGNRPEILPLSTKDCSHSTITNRSTDERNNASGDAITHFNGSLNISLMKEDVDDESKNKESSPMMYLYGISYLLYMVIGPSLVVVIGVIESYFTGVTNPEEVNPKLVFGPSLYVYKKLWKVFSNKKTVIISTQNNNNIDCVTYIHTPSESMEQNEEKIL